MFSLYKWYDEKVDICKNNVGKLFSKLYLDTEFLALFKYSAVVQKKWEIILVKEVWNTIVWCFFDLSSCHSDQLICL